MVSAVADGEASEFEYRRVLGALRDAEVGGLLERHFTLRAVARQEAQLLCPAALSARIFDALEHEPALGTTFSQVGRWRMRIGGAAVAASVCLMAVVGMRSLVPGPEASSGAVAAGGVSVGNLGQPAARPMTLSAGAPALGLARAVSDGPSRPGANTPDRLAEQRLRLFLGEHAENAALNSNQGMIPLARVASYQAP